VFPLLVSIVATAIYARLPKERQGSALMAPISLLILIVVPAVAFALALYDFGAHGPR